MDMVDFIVVGGGIAGSCMAYELLQRGQSVVLFDENFKDAACLVAAGVINPITGQRLVKSWRSNVAHPYAKNFYANLEKELCAQFYHPRKILQICKSSEESDLWYQRSYQEDYKPYIGSHFKANSFPPFNDANGSHLIEHSAWVESKRIMWAFAKYFDSINVRKSEKFIFSELNTSASHLEYNGIKAKKIIFADGWRVRENPFFNWLPYRPAKGEILEMHLDIDIPDYIIHRGNWIMKSSENICRMGSTWDRNNLNTLPTQAAKTELLQGLVSMLGKCKSEIVNHEAGIRPCTATTRPHIGAYPTDSRILSFNGFGSKGYALSPYFAKHFADHLLNSLPLDPEADLKRHTRKFFSVPKGSPIAVGNSALFSVPKASQCSIRRLLCNALKSRVHLPRSHEPFYSS